MKTRDHSWLEFNERVLQLAYQEKVPLLERCNFLSIYGSNLDEFIRVRLGVHLRNKNDSEFNTYMDIIKRQRLLVNQTIYSLHNLLSHETILLADFKDISKADKKYLFNIFEREVKPYLSVQYLDKKTNFPFIKNFTNVFFVAFDEKDRFAMVTNQLEKSFVKIRIEEKTYLVLINDLIKLFEKAIFKDKKIIESGFIRVLRNADLMLDHMFDLEHDFQDKVLNAIENREKQKVVCLQASKYLKSHVTNYLFKKLKIDKNQLLINENIIDLSIFSLLKKEYEELYPHLTYPSIQQFDPLSMNNDLSIQLLKKPFLICYPFHSSDLFSKVIYDCANNLNIKEIKISLYRVAKFSKVISALCYAAEKGIKVSCLIELRARFDEKSNLYYSKILQDAGCHVYYGLEEKKVHSKLFLATFKEKNKVRYLSFFGTGNSNEQTQKLYTDLGYFSPDIKIGEELDSTFNHLFNNETFLPTSFWLAPDLFKNEFLNMVDQQIHLGNNGFIEIKCNSLNDPEIIDKLLEAADSGVKVSCIIRGICCFDKKIPNLTVKSVLGQYLEHSRVYRFGKENPRIWIGSADLLVRNTQQRVEALVEITEKSFQNQLIQMLANELSSECDGWYLNEEGVFKYKNGESSQQLNYKIFTDNDFYMERSKERNKKLPWYKRLFKLWS